MGREDNRQDTSLIPHFLVFLLLQIWSRDSDEPVHSLKINRQCRCLAWLPNGKTDDVDGGIDAA